ncbi:hypothetical protein ACFVYA_34595 [Amycolatopsis sp. NPDC058278]|uniref:hypothetical protein n=1 Tax=Amycolatopsis sp. NPDC058278 TaxID=3346417 RepID=UPI0036DEEC5D
MNPDNLGPEGVSVVNPIAAATAQSTPYGRMKSALADVLLVQADASDAGVDIAIERSDRLGGGIVLTGESALQKAEHLVRGQRYRRPILVDRSRYTGKNRALASDHFDLGWIQRQRRLDLPVVIPNAGYVGEHDGAGLDSVLQRSAASGSDVAASLFLHVSWLQPDKLPRLVDAVTDAGTPIAVAFEHANDPLGTKYAIYGLVALLQIPAPVILLRCDTSSIGALAYGVLAAAVGTRSSLRHFYPISDGAGGGKPKPAAVVERLLSYVHLEKIDLTAQMDPDHPDWHCTCDVCNGQSLQQLGSAPDPSLAAFLHSIEILYRIRREILRGGDLSTRRKAWTEQCSHAQFKHMEIDTTHFAWEVPSYLGRWVQRGNDSSDLSLPAQGR